MTFVQHLERLNAILDVNSQASLYTLAQGTEFDQGFSLASGVTASQGRAYGYDSLLMNAAPLQLPRRTKWKFVHAYAAGETWSTLKASMMAAFGHGRPVLLQKTLADGTVLVAEARLSDFPDTEVVDTQVLVEFPITFEQHEDWRAKDTASLRYDSGLHYDAGLHYDVIGLQYPLAGATTTFTVTNSGDINERESLIQLNGPMTGPFTFVNFACDVRGIPGGTPAITLTIAVASLASGEWVKIDGKANQVTSNKAGIVPWAVVTKAQGQQFYMEFVPGSNGCQFAKGNGTVEGSLYIQTPAGRWR